MNNEILALLDFFERDRGIKREVLLEAINTALLTAARKAVGPARDLRVEIDPKSGNIKAIAKLCVVERVTNKHDEISLTEAVKRCKPDAVVGEQEGASLASPSAHRPAASPAHGEQASPGARADASRHVASATAGASSRLVLE